jgi:hypothetical protein
MKKIALGVTLVAAVLMAGLVVPADAALSWKTFGSAQASSVGYGAGGGFDSTTAAKPKAVRFRVSSPGSSEGSVTLEYEIGCWTATQHKTVKGKVTKQTPFTVSRNVVKDLGFAPNRCWAYAIATREAKGNVKLVAQSQHA